MKERPIIFSAPMVNALLAGRKSQTRRVLKPQPPFDGGIASGVCGDGPVSIAIYPSDLGGGGGHYCKTPFAKRDRLYVREACATWIGDHRDVVYRADEPDEEWSNLRHDAKLGLWKLRPSIHMPRWASRLTLIVTDVRVQRLQDISEEDAKAEGVGIEETVSLDCGDISGVRSVSTGILCSDHRDAMRETWSKIHGPGAWDANPWVCAISFTVHRQNIDEMKEGAK